MFYLPCGKQKRMDTKEILAWSDCNRKMHHLPQSPRFQQHFLAQETYMECVTCHVDKASGIHVIAAFVFSNKGHPTKGFPDPARPGRKLSSFHAQAVIIPMHQIQSIFLLTVHQRPLVYAVIVIISKTIGVVSLHLT